MKNIDFKTSQYFSDSVIVAGVVLLAPALLVIFNSLFIGLLLCLSSVIIFTTHYRLTIDLENKVYHDYIWILGLKKGVKGKFDRVQYLFIKNNTVSETMNLRVASTTIQKEVFDGYLKFSETVKIHLLAADDKNTLVKKLREIATLLSIRIIDYTEGEPKEL